MTAPTGLVSWWLGEGDANDHLGANDGTASGQVDYVPRKVGEAIAFTSGGSVVAGSSGLPTGGDDRTVEAWVRIDALYQPSGPNQGLFFGYGTWGSLDSTIELLVDGPSAGSTLTFS